MSSTTAEDAFPQQVGPPEAFGRPDQQKEEGKDQKSDSKQRGQAGQKKDEKGNDEGNKKPPFYKRPVLMTVLIVIFLVVVVGGVLWWLHARQYESTDDAFIDGHVIPISPQVAALVRVLHIDDN